MSEVGKYPRLAFDAQVDAIEAAESASSLKGGGGGDTLDPMEPRVAALEDGMKEVRTDLKAIRIDLAEIKSKLSSMPSSWQMIGICASMIALVIAGSGALLAILRFITLTP